MIFAVVGYSGAGKTINILKLITKLKAKGFKIAVIKCSHHDFSINPAGKDTTRFFEQGANLTIFYNGVELVSICRATSIEKIIDDIKNIYDVIIIEGNVSFPCAKISVDVMEKIVDTPDVFEKLDILSKSVEY